MLGNIITILVVLLDAPFLLILAQKVEYNHDSCLLLVLTLLDFQLC
jgi:hypothetical protein